MKVPVLAAALLLARAAPLPAQAAGKFDQVPVNPVDEAYIFTPRGFEREGRVAVASGAETGCLHVVVHDREGGRQAACRVNVVGADGNFYQPEENRLTPFSLIGAHPEHRGNRPSKAPIRYLGRSFYTLGEFKVDVPAGPVRVEAWKGFEHEPRAARTTILPGTARDLELTLERTLPAAELGYYSGDPHLHFERKTDAGDELILDLMEAEDIQHGVILCYNEPTSAYTGQMEKQETPQLRGLGAAALRSRGDYSIISAQEYRSTHYGHLLLFLRDHMVLDGVTLDPSSWPVYGVIGRETQKEGGFALYAHGGYAQEICADFVQRAVNGVELLQFGIYRGIGLEGWYRILNAGYRFPAFGASDYPMCRWLGDCRTYVYRSRRPTFAEWFRGLAEGRSFMTSGPLLFLEVDGEKPGATLEKAGKGPHRVTARVRARCEVAPVTNLELVANGARVGELVVPAVEGKGRWLELERSLDLAESTWIAARAYSRAPSGSPDAEAHTNPVYVYLEGKAPFKAADVDWLLGELDAQIAAQERRVFSGQLEALAYFRRSRDLLLELRRQGGQPAAPVTAVPAEESAAGPAAAPSLKEFLKPVPPREPAEALKTFETAAGFKLELVAQEPLVTDPIAAAFDADGRLYVAEMRDYPYKPKAGEAPLGRVSLLEDTDADGKFDRASIFAEELLWPSGIAPWKQGVYVAAAPDIWYLKDTDGDRRADVRQKVYSGFGTGNQQGMLNNLIWGLDHKIYGATSMEGGSIRPAGEPETEPVSLLGKDFRFDPASGRFETQTGTAQFGNAFDDWQNRFVCSESHPALHVVLPREYLARNPHLAVSEAIKNIAEGGTRVYRTSPVEAWRIIRSSRRVASEYLPDSNPAVSHDLITAAAGLTIYRGAAYPKEYHGNLFVSCAQTNVIHRRLLAPDGVTFKAIRAEENTEFVRSSDIWFRPVNLINAPDGTLYALDMYREFLESVHIPQDVVELLDLTSGRDRGRIYRISPPGFKVPPPPRLGEATTEELVAQLENPNGWWRDTAHRLLYERAAGAAVAPLRRLLAESAMPQARLHALWSLHGLGALADPEIAAALSDAASGVREHAVRLAEPRLNQSAALLESVLALADDASARVEFQAAFSLGEAKDPRAVSALARIARRHAADPWMRAAVLSSSAQAAGRLLEELTDDETFAAGAAGAAMLEELALIAGARNEPAETRRVLELAAGRARGAAAPDLKRRPDLKRSIVIGLGEGLKRAGADLEALEEGSPPAVAMLRELRDWARRTAASGEAEEAQRREAIRLLGAGRFSGDVKETLAAIVSRQEPHSVQLAAVRALRSWGEPEIASLFLGAWRAYSPPVRAEVLQALLAREDWIRQLLDAVDGGEVAAGEIDATRRTMLIDHRDASIRERARKLFGAEASSPRQEVVAAYRSALDLAGEPGRGEKVYEQHCMTCHPFGKKGQAVGPNLALTQNRTPEALLAEILDPNREVNPAYVDYAVVDRQGAVFTGLLAAETASSVTLKRAGEVCDTILRQDIQEITSTGRSLMPEGLEAVVKPQEMADLITFILTSRYDLGTRPGAIEPGR